MNWKGYTGRLHEMVSGPGLFVAASLVYIAIAVASAQDPMMHMLSDDIGVGPVSVAVFIAGLLFYALGLRTSRFLVRASYAPLAIGFAVGFVTAHFALGLDVLPAVAANALAVALSWVMLGDRVKHEFLFGMGALLFWVNFALNGIPVLDPMRHAELFTFVNPLFVMGFFLMLYSAVRMHPGRRYLWLIIFASTLLSTYRIYLGISFIAYMLMEFRPGKGHRAAVPVTGAVLVVLAFLLIGQMVMVDTHSGWSLNAMRTLEYRLAITFSAFDDIVNMAFPLGKTFGASFMHEFTEYTCNLLYGYGSRITSTAFGQLMLDFGLVGIGLAAWFIGALIAMLHIRDYGLYVILLASLVACIDTGINAFLLLEFIYIGWMRVMKI